MDETFTNKEIETIRLIHEFRKNIGYGRITIEFHNHDIAQYEILSNMRPKGGTADVDFAQKIFSLFLINQTIPKDSFPQDNPLDF